ncbi:MAG: TldD/PmbA family protein [Desulfarculus sp.]|nr:MAG: TldD/PmbA family protein [Desulfarculus sp.]
MELSRALDLARAKLECAPCEQWEVMALHSQSTSIGVRGQELDKFQENQSLGLALRVVTDGRLGFSYLLGGDEAALAEAVAQALASAAASDPEPAVGLAGPAGPLPAVEVYDPELAAESVEAKLARARELAAAALAADPRVVHVQPAEFSSAVSTLHLCTSGGLELCHQGTQAGAGVVAVASQNGEQEMAWEGHSARFLAELDIPALGAAAGRKAAAFLGARPVADGRYDVLLENSVAVQFLELLAESLKGDGLLKGRSLLAGREGQLVASPLVSIIDDGLYPRGLGTAALDDEGTPQQRTPLVQGGALRGFIYDRLWGARAGRASTGNAVRPSLKNPPGVGFSNLYLEPGAQGPDELTAGLGRGLIISEIMGGHTADPVSGQFSFGAAGHLVENGRLSRPVKSIAMAGQVLELFQAVRAVGSDLRFFGRSGAPCLLVGGMSISGPG